MARKKLNKNLVITLTLFVFASVIVLSVLMLRQLQRSDPQHFIALAEKYKAEGHWAQATLFYTKAWERTRDHQYLIAAGDMQLEAGEVGRAMAAWREVVTNRPQTIEAHRRQLNVLVEFGRLYGSVDNWQQVNEAAEGFLEAVPDMPVADEAFARNANGMALVNMETLGPEHVEQGLEELGRAVELDPDKVAYAIDLARESALHDHTEEAERIFGELLERYTSPGADASTVRLAYAQYLGRHGDTAQAEAFYKEAVALAEDAPEALARARRDYAVSVAQQWVEALRDPEKAAAAPELFAQAEATLQKCIDTDPDLFEPYLAMVRLYINAERYEDAVRVAEDRLGRGFSRKGIKATHDKVAAFRLMLLAASGSVAKAHGISAKEEPERRNEWLQRAQAFVDEAAGEFPDHPSLLHERGQIKLAQGLDREALALFRQADESFEVAGVVDWQNKISLATLHLKLGEPGAAKAALEDVVEQANDVRVWLLYAQALFQNNEPNRALAAADQILLNQPDNAAARRIKTAVYERLGRTREARTLADSPTLRAMLDARERAIGGEMEAAVDVLTGALREAPDDMQLLTTTVRTLVSLDRAEEAQALLQDAAAAHPDNEAVEKLLVATRPGLSREERARRFRDLIDAESDPYKRAWDLMDLATWEKDYEAAMAHLNEAERHLIARDTPAARNATITQHRLLLRLKMRLAVELDDDAALTEARDSAVRHNVDGANGLAMVGLYHMYREEYRQGIIALRKAVDLQPTLVHALTMLAQGLQLTDQPEEAATYYRRALQIDPNDRVSHKGLAFLAKQRGDMDAYQRHLSVCAQLLPGDPWVRSELEARAEQADPAAAIARREAKLEDDPDNVANLARLAQLCETVGDTAKADAYYDRLRSLSLDASLEKDLIITLANYYRRTDRPELALDVVTTYADSRKTPEQEANALILVASHYLAESQLEQVRDTLLHAADIATTFKVARSLGNFYARTMDRPDEALPWIDKAISLVPDEEDEQLVKLMALRIACLLHRRVSDLDRARVAIADFSDRFPDDPRRALWISELRAREGEFEQAIDALNEYLATRINDPFSLFQRAQYYRALGRLGSAIEDLNTIKHTEPLALDLEPRLLLAELHAQAGDDQASLRELESLVADAPDDERALTALARAYIEQGRLADADRLITARINRDGAAAAPQWLFLRGDVSLSMKEIDKALADYLRGAERMDFAVPAMRKIMIVYEGLGRHEDAIAFYEDHAPRNPASAELAARYGTQLVRAGRTEQAVAVFRQAMANAIADSASAIRDVYVQLVRAFGESEETARETVALFEGEPGNTATGRANDRILVRLYRLAGRAEDATETLDKLVQTAAVKQERADLLVEQGELKQVDGRHEEARHAYEEALKYDQDNWIALNNLAYLLANDLAKPRVALPYAQRAVAIADTPETLDTLGWIYVGLGQYSRAIAELGRAVRLNPDFTLSYYHLGEAYRRNQQFVEAKGMLAAGRGTADATDDADLVALMDAAHAKASRSDSAP